MTLKGWKCANCGGTIPDDPEKDVLTCPSCGATWTKDLSEYDKSLKYLREKDIREEKERKEDKEHNRKEANKALYLMLGIFFLLLFYLLFHEKLGF